MEHKRRNQRQAGQWKENRDLIRSRLKLALKAVKVAELANQTHLSRPTVYKHLNELRAIGEVEWDQLNHTAKVQSPFTIFHDTLTRVTNALDANINEITIELRHKDDPARVVRIEVAPSIHEPPYVESRYFVTYSGEPSLSCFETTSGPLHQVVSQRVWEGGLKTHLPIRRIRGTSELTIDF